MKNPIEQNDREYITRHSEYQHIFQTVIEKHRDVRG